MIDGELFERVEELGLKQASIILLLERAIHWCANASPNNFNLIAICKTFVLQWKDQYDFILHVVLIIVQVIHMIYFATRDKVYLACMQYLAMNGSMMAVTSPIQAFLCFSWNENNSA